MENVVNSPNLGLISRDENIGTFTPTIRVFFLGWGEREGGNFPIAFRSYKIYRSGFLKITIHKLQKVDKTGDIQIDSLNNG